MKKYFILLFSVLLYSITSYSKDINFTLPTKALKDYVFTTYNGLKIDTLAIGKTDFAGNGAIKIKSEYDSIPYVGVLLFADNQAMDLIVAEGDFSFKEVDGKLQFNNSLQNDLFYNKKNEILTQEYQGLFVQEYMLMMANVMQLNQLARNEQANTMVNATKVRLDGLKYINPDILYYTKFWNWGINGFLLLSNSQETFSSDMIQLLDKTKNQNVYNAFVEDLITITNQYGLDDAFVIIIKHVMDSGRIQYPQGVLFDAFQSLKVYKGSKVQPFSDLEKLDFEPVYTLLVFNTVGCEHCAIEMKKLVELYPLLEQKKVRVITITSALSQKEFLEDVNPYPWKDKIMDNTDYNKSLFRSFGIIGTPTMYLLDSDNVVKEKFSLVDVLIRSLD